MHMNRLSKSIGSRKMQPFGLSFCLIAFGAMIAMAAQPGNQGPVPPPNVPGVVVLFSGRQSDIAKNWQMIGSGQPADWTFDNGAMMTTNSDIVSKRQFKNFYLHVEWREPEMPNAQGQANGNSGVYLQGRYEIQVLNSYGIASPGTGDCGAVYGEAAPLVNACKPTHQWQAYDIVFRAPEYNPTTHQLIHHARVTVLQNGIVIQNNQEISGPTAGAMGDAWEGTGPIRLQYHGDKVEYRNVWVVPLPDHGANHY